MEKINVNNLKLDFMCLSNQAENDVCEIRVVNLADMKLDFIRLKNYPNLYGSDFGLKIDFRDGEPTKVCNECGVRKEYSVFHKNQINKDNYIHRCKKCRSNSLSEKESHKLWLLNNKEKTKGYDKKHRENENNRKKIKEKDKEYYQKNKKEISKKNKIYRDNNKEKIYKTVYEYEKKRIKNDPLYKLQKNIRTLIRIILKNKTHKKTSNTKEILGCSFEEFKNHLEKQFDNNMNWGNQGSYWHNDHIIPVSFGKTEEEILLLNHWSNFQPLEAKTNIIKGNKVQISEQELNAYFQKIRTLHFLGGISTLTEHIEFPKL